MVHIPGSESCIAKSGIPLWRRFLLVVSTILVLGSIAFGAEVTNYTTTWLGNTWPGSPYFQPSWGTGKIGKHANYHLMDICVTANGTIIGTSYWEESARYAPIYDAHGENIGHLTRNDGMNSFDCGAVAADGSYVWASNVYADVPGYVSRFNFTTMVYTDVQARLSQDKVWGLAVNGKELYVSDTIGNTVKVVTADTLTPLRSWTVTAPGKLAIEKSGNVWVLTRHATPKAICYTSTGTKLSEITFPADVDPQDIAINPTNGRILIADAGIHSQVRIYAVQAGAVALESTLGADYGIFSGVKGEVGPLKFNRPNCVGVDSAGNIYVASNGGLGGYECGAEMESYTPERTRRWSVYGLEFTDIAAVDPGSESDIFTKYHHYTMDYTKDTGKEWAYKGFTYDKFAFPDDMRNLGYGLGYTRMARMARKKFLVLDQTSLCFFRFDAEKWGEVAIPSAMFIPTTVNRTPLPGLNHAPAIWRDSNGDGKFDANEYQYLNISDPAGGVWQVMPNGDVIFGGSFGHADYLLYTWKCQGLDVHGNPIYPTTPTSAVPLPYTLRHVHRLEYDAAADTMYLGGFSDEYPGDDEGFRIIRAYPHWSLGNRTPRWTITTPYHRNGNIWDVARSFTIAGDYVFYAYFSEQEGTVPQNSVYIYRKSDGSYVGHLQPSAQLGFPGGLDFSFPITAYQKADGEYLIMLEAAYYDLTLIYRWSDNTAGKVARPTISPAPSALQSPGTVTINCATSGAIVRYTTDGTDPTASSPLYTVPVILTKTTTLKTRAFKSGMSESLMTTGVYTQARSLGLFTNDDNIGGVLPSGSGSESAGTYTVHGSGDEFFYASDSGHYLYRTLTGNGCITARVASLTPTALWAKAGIMIRENLSVGSKYAAALVTPYAGLDYAWRTGTGGATSGSALVAGPLAPYWLRLTRTGDVFSGEYSPDGVTWAPFANKTTIAMPATVTIGLVICANNPGTLGTVTYTDVTVIGTATVTAPTFSAAAGTYYTGQHVIISTTTTGAIIRYTTDGTTPTATTGTLYTNPVSITATSTLKAMAYKTGWTDSSVTSGAYTITSTGAAPIFDAPAGLYTTAQTVTIITKTPDATIRYTTDGTTPSGTSGNIYTTPVTIDVTKTLKAIAYKSDLTNSSVTSGVFTIKCATPTASPEPGTYASAQSVTLNTTTKGATIRFTTNGATPSSTVGTVYSNPIALGQITTLKAMAYKNRLADSDVTTGVYTNKCATPAFGTAAGSYSALQTVPISSASGATIRYTTDGTMPSPTVGMVYRMPVVIDQDTTLKAIAYRNDLVDSDVASGDYYFLRTGQRDTVWLEDTIPDGATASYSGGDTWNWVTNNPTPYSGTKAHRSAAANGLHQHWFENAARTLSIGTGDRFYAYVYLDPANPPHEVMLQWKSRGWEHRAYWGANLIDYGTLGTVSRRYMGVLPSTGKWVRLEVPAGQVGLEGTTADGMCFSLYGGNAVWDHAGKDSGPMKLISTIAVPTSVKADGGIGWGRVEGNTINGSGLSAPVADGTTPPTTWPTCAADAATNWLCPSVANAVLTFDFGTTKTISGFHYWAYSEDATWGPPSCIKAMNVEYSADGTYFTKLATDTRTYPISKNDGTDMGCDVTFTPVNCRYIRFDTMTNYNGPNVGLSEVRFIQIAQ